MRRLITVALSTLAIATIVAPAAALTDRFEEEFYEGLGNHLTDRFEEEFYEGLGNQLTDRFEEEFYEGLGNQ